MITRDNLADVLKNISKGDLKRIYENEKDYDYVEVVLHVFNVGVSVSVENVENFNEELEAEGNLCMDVNDFFATLDSFEISYV